MVEIKYHSEYFKRILKLVEKECYDRAITEFLKYVQNYPKDIIAYIYFADVYLKLGNIEPAEFLLYQARSLINISTSEVVIENYLIIKIKLLYYQNKIKESYKLFQKYTPILSTNTEYDNYILEVFFKTKLGIIPTKNHPSCYIIDQIQHYSSNKAIKHIIERHQSEFVTGFPLKKVFHQVQRNIHLNLCIYNELLTNVYTFKYLANGHKESHLVDYIDVVTLHNSNKIITMYPNDNNARKSFIDLTPDLEKTYKLKRTKQIDKFINKYGVEYSENNID